MDSYFIFEYLDFFSEQFRFYIYKFFDTYLSHSDALESFE